MRNIHVLLITQALLLLLLFFSEGYIKYATIGLFILFDIMLLASLIKRKWSSEELLTFAAVFASGLFLVLFVFMQSTNTMILGGALVLLFLVIAILYVSSSRNMVKSRLEKPQLPEFKYAIEYEPYHESSKVETIQRNNRILDEDEYIYEKTPEPVMHIKQPEKQSKVKDKLLAKAVAYELERETQQMKNAQHIMDKVEVYNSEKELKREASQIKDAQKVFDNLKIYDTEQELKREASKIKNAQKIFDDVKIYNAEKELDKEARELLEVQRQISQIKDLQTKQSKVLKNTKKVTTKLKKDAKVSKVSSEKKLGKDIEKAVNAAIAIKTVKISSKPSQSKKSSVSKSDTKKSKFITTKKSKEDAKKKQDQIKFLEKQEKFINEAKAIATAQKAISELNAATVKATTKATSKANKSKPQKETKIVKVKSLEESFYFATENGNKFHEPGCMSIKDVPKNRLTLYTSRKDAMRKGLRPCGTCIPK